MPDYTVITLTAEGRRERHRVTGRDADDACTRLRAGGVFVERILPAGHARRFLALTKISPRHLIEFFRQMEMLLSSGVLIADALNRLKDRYPDRRARRVLREVHAQVAESRTSLSQALSRFPRSFSPGVVTVIEAGEEGAPQCWPSALGTGVERTAYEEGNRRQVWSACAYPLFVFIDGRRRVCASSLVSFSRALTELLASLGGGLRPSPAA